jgi:hypothetical protein
MLLVLSLYFQRGLTASLTVVAVFLYSMICGQAIFLLLRVGRSGSRRSTTTTTESIWGDFTTSVCEENHIMLRRRHQ